MKSRPARVLWIDDDRFREKDAQNLAGPGLEVAFAGPIVMDEDPKRLERFDLLLVDYKLDRETVDGKRVHFRGPAIVGLLRSVNDEIPAYLLSSDLPTGRASFSGMTWFDDEWELEKLQDIPWATKRLREDIRDYQRIRKVRPGANAVQRLLALLDVPTASETATREAIPVSLKAAWAPKDAPRSEMTTDVTGSLGFARWIRRMLLVRPGPLSDQLNAATRVGLTPKRFAATKLSIECRYTGVFAHTHEEGRWWTAAIDDKVFELQRRNNVGPGAPWEVGPQVFKIKDRDLLRCAVCEELFPDIVATSAVDRNVRSPVHTRCSEPDAERDLTPFFDEPRIYPERE